MLIIRLYLLIVMWIFFWNCSLEGAEAGLNTETVFSDREGEDNEGLRARASKAVYKWKLCMSRGQGQGKLFISLLLLKVVKTVNQ